MSRSNIPMHRPVVTVADQALADRCARGRVVIIDDDVEIVSALAALITFSGYACETYLSALAYLRELNSGKCDYPGACCVLCDVNMPEMDGLELQRRLLELNNIPMLLMSGASGAQEVVSAYHAGALDFLIKPIDGDVLLTAIKNALLVSKQRQEVTARTITIAQRLATLTVRERDIAQRVVVGKTNPAIAEELDIALRTVKLHRHRMMQKLGVNTYLELMSIADQIKL